MGCVLTLSGPVLDVDGLRLVLSVLVLHADQVAVRLAGEAGSQRQHVVIAVVDGLQHLPTADGGQTRTSAHSCVDTEQALIQFQPPGDHFRLYHWNVE